MNKGSESIKYIEFGNTDIERRKTFAFFKC